MKTRRLLTFHDLSNRGIPWVRDHLRRKCKAGEFPAPVQISPHRIGWFEDEIDAWVAALPKQVSQSQHP